MESVYFSGTVCTSRTDEGKADVDNFHIYHEISDYSTEVCSHVIFFEGASQPSPWQIKSETRRVSINWICTYFVSKNMTLCPVFLWLASNVWSSNVIYRHKGPVLTVFFFSFKYTSAYLSRFSQSKRVQGFLIPWRDSPVWSAGEASGVVAGQDSQSAC